jgi:hypothetical protein
VVGLDNRRIWRIGASYSGGPTGAGGLTPLISDQTIGDLEFGGGYVVSATTGRPTDIDDFIAH